MRGTSFIYSMLRFSGIPFLVRELFQRNRVTILLYHDVDTEIFRNHIRTIKQFYNPISLQEFLKWKKRNESIDIPKYPVILTIDDGHAGNFDLLSVIREEGVPVTIFLCSDIVNTNRHFWFRHAEESGLDPSGLKHLSREERVSRLSSISFDFEREYETRHALDLDEILAMKPWVDFQSHTRFHEILPTCDDDVSRTEIGRSKMILEREFGFEINSISYPNGDYSDREIELTRGAGYECGVTVDCGYNTAKTDVFRLKRISYREDCGTNELIVKLSGMICAIRSIFSRR